MRLLLEGGCVLLPITPTVSEAITSIPTTVANFHRLLDLNCADYIQELPSHSVNPEIKYVQSYEKPDRRVIIKDDPDHVICIPSKPFIKSTLTTIPTCGVDLVVVDKYRIRNKIIGLEEHKVSYNVYKEKIPEARNFNTKTSYNIRTRARDLAIEADLRRNEEEFNMEPKLKIIVMNDKI